MTIKITKADQAILEASSDLIQNGDTVMIYAKSRVIEDIILAAHKQGISFSVIIVDNPPFNEGKQLFERLSEHEIECIYTLLSHSGYFMKSVTKVFVGASTMLNNGALVSRVGTALLSCICKEFRKPLHVFCESYKFSEKSYLDTLSFNSWINNAEEKFLKANTKMINIKFDLTPAENINMLVTEYGKVPS